MSKVNLLALAWAKAPKVVGGPTVNPFGYTPSDPNQMHVPPANHFSHHNHMHSPSIFSHSPSGPPSHHSSHHSPHSISIFRINIRF